MPLEKILRQIQKAKFWRDKKILNFLGFCLGINILAWLDILFQARKTGQAIPLRYNILVGIDSIGHWTKLLRLPFYGLIILLINFLLIYKIYQKGDKFFLNLLLFSTLGIQIILLLATILISNL